MNLNEIKIVIVEDSPRDLCAIKNGLKQIKNNSSDMIDEDNIYGIQINNADDLKKTTKTIKGFNPDILFIDLHLVDNIDDGKNLIENLMIAEASLKYIPKYIISSADKVFDNSDYSDLFQYAYPIRKPEMKGLEGDDEEQCKALTSEYHQIFEGRHKLNQTLPLLAGMYRKIVEKFEVTALLNALEFKIDEAQINNEQIIKHLNIQSKVLDKIKLTTENIDERTQLIEIITKATAKALPKISNSAKAKDLIEEWERDDIFRNGMEDYFPNKPVGLYQKMKDIVNGFSDTAFEDIGELLYNAGKEYLDEIAGIEEDDKNLVRLTKYSAFFTERISDFVLRK